MDVLCPCPLHGLVAVAESQTERLQVVTSVVVAALVCARSPAAVEVVPVASAPVAAAPAFASSAVALPGAASVAGRLVAAVVGLPAAELAAAENEPAGAVPEAVAVAEAGPGAVAPGDQLLVGPSQSQPADWPVSSCFAEPQFVDATVVAETQPVAVQQFVAVAGPRLLVDVQPLSGPVAVGVQLLFALSEAAAEPVGPLVLPAPVARASARPAVVVAAAAFAPFQAAASGVERRDFRGRLELPQPPVWPSAALVLDRWRLCSTGSTGPKPDPRLAGELVQGPAQLQCDDCP